MKHVLRLEPIFQILFFHIYIYIYIYIWDRPKRLGSPPDLGVKSTKHIQHFGMVFEALRFHRPSSTIIIIHDHHPSSSSIIHNHHPSSSANWPRPDSFFVWTNWLRKMTSPVIHLFVIHPPTRQNTPPWVHDNTQTKKSPPDFSLQRINVLDLILPFV